MASGESKDERDKRVDKLWETLDTRKEGHIDLTELKKGLKKIDHREFDQAPCSIPARLSNLFSFSSKKCRRYGTECRPGG